MAKAGPTSNYVPIARLLSVESQVNKITAEMEKLILISTQHGSRIKELIVASSNSVSQVEMTSTVTTTRFQHMNDLKALRKNLQAKYEDLGSGNVVSTHDEMDSKDTKALTSKIDELQNELSNSNFKASMEVNKLKMELKSSKKDYDELKRFVTVLETKLGALVQDAKENGIKTSVQMDDMPEITYQPTGTARRASILNPDAGIPTTPQSHRPSFSAGGHTPHAMSAPGSFPLAHDFHGQPFHPHGGHHDGHFLSGHFMSGASFHHPIAAQGAGFFPMPGQQLDPEQMQQLQLGYQQQMYFQQQYAAQVAAQPQGHQTGTHHPHSTSVYLPGMPMSDSGMSTPGASPSTQQLAAGGSMQRGSVFGSDPTAMYGAMAQANRMFHPYAFLPYQFAQPHGPHSAAHGGDPDNHALQGLGGPATQLSRDEKYYKAQFRAVKELILASMEGKDLVSLEPEGLHSEVKHHRHEEISGSRLMVTSTGPATDDSQVVMDATTAAVENVPTRRELLAKFDLRHRNRDLYRNLRKVKDVEKIAMNYADFCVTNAINCVDEGAYRAFKENVIGEQFAQRLKKTEGQCEAAVQTEEQGNGHSGDAYQRGETHGSVIGASAAHGTVQAREGGSVLSALQRLRAQQSQQAQDNSELAILAHLARSAVKPALDFGAAIEPALTQYSSAGRRQSLMQLGCVFEEDLRDPALKFLETTTETIDEEDEESDFGDGESGSDREGSHSKPPSRDGVRSRSPSVMGSPATGTRPSVLRKLSSFPMAGSAAAARKASVLQTNRRSSSLRKFVGSESEHADLESLRTELTALMDRKLMKLYQGLDDRWKGLDEANLSILQKLTRFQEVLVALNADSQRLQATVHVLAQGLAKTDKRMYDALEPVYIALDEQKSNMANLEGIMVDVARQLKALENRPVPTVVVSRHVPEWSVDLCSYLMRCPVCSGV
jgi:hypothetical protein